MPTSLRNRQIGFSLFEVIIGLALTVGLSATVWALASPTGAISGVSQETIRLNALTESIDHAFAGNVDYAGVTTANELREGWFPTGFDPSNSVWGPFDVSPATTVSPADSWMAIYQGVTVEACTKLIAVEVASNNWASILVGGRSVSAATVVSACEDLSTASPTGGHEVTLLHYSGPRNGGSTGLQPLCFDRFRNDPRGYEPGCPTDPLKYSPAPKA